MSYSLRRHSDGAGCSGLLLEVGLKDDDGKWEWYHAADIVEGCIVKVGGLRGDYWMTTPVTSIVKRLSDADGWTEIEFETANSRYTLKAF